METYRHSMGVDELNRTVLEGREISVPTDEGTVIIRGLDAVTNGDDTTTRYADVSLEDDMGQTVWAHRGRLVTASIRPGSRITVRNSGGRYRTGKVDGP